MNLTIIPNFISLIRIPLAFLFLYENVSIRFAAICCALITDGLDGFLARKFDLQTNVGRVLDPLTDKFFVFVVLGMLFKEGSISFWEISAMLTRDFSIFIFGIYLTFQGNLRAFEFKSLWMGKISTCLQLTILLAIVSRIEIPAVAYGALVFFGLLAIPELFFTRNILAPKHR